VSAREVLRDLRTERGETPATDPYDELLEAAELQREGTTEADPVARELASQVLDEAGAAECLRAMFPGFRPK
jgi:hypothetical protein